MLTLCSSWLSSLFSNGFVDLGFRNFTSTVAPSFRLLERFNLILLVSWVVVGPLGAFSTLILFSDLDLESFFKVDRWKKRLLTEGELGALLELGTDLTLVLLNKFLNLLTAFTLFLVDIWSALFCLLFDNVDSMMSEICLSNRLRLDRSDFPDISSLGWSPWGSEATGMSPTACSCPTFCWLLLHNASDSLSTTKTWKK